MQTAQPLEQVFVHSLMTHAHNYYLQLHAADDIVLSMFEKQFSVFGWLHIAPLSSTFPKLHHSFTYPSTFYPIVTDLQSF